MTDSSSKDQSNTNLAVWGSDVIASAIREQGFPYVCLNPGASYRGLHDSLVNYLGNTNPQMIVCLHEEHAVAMAQGYAQVTDKPLAVIVHSNVGLMHATMAVFDAWCKRVPVVIFGATGPVDAAKRRPWIDWIHTAADQGAQIRDYTKWDDQPGSAESAVESVRRATTLAKTRPFGPVYVNFDAAIQETQLDEWPELYDASKFAPPASPAPVAEDLDQLADVLGAAKSPLILAGRSSTDEGHWAQRIDLAERIGARVITGQGGAAFPTTHPLYAGETNFVLRPDLRQEFEKADAVLALDWIDLGGMLHQAYPVGSTMPKIVNVSVDHHVHKGWSMDYNALPPVDLHIATTPEPVTVALLGKLPKRKTKYERIEPDLPTMPKGSGSISVSDMAAVFLNVTKDQPIAILGRTIGWPPEAGVIEHPEDYIGGTGGAGIGAGPGIAVGAALALRDRKSPRVPVAIVGDGDYTMSSNALWTAAAAKIPLLVIVGNNRAYFNDELHQQRVAETRSRAVENAWVGQRIEDPAPDLVMIARGHGLEGEGPITDLAELPGAIVRAIEAVKNGASYVLDVVVDREYVNKALSGGRKT
ncbi:MAG: thiamine pyrophosphate-binding protein [Pseudomonadota bacterium]|nr:thiamine pyrophosphate-binding protein [Pseudomonadota bacterium]